MSDRPTAENDAALEAMRANLLHRLLAQPSTESRDTYADGYEQGLATALEVFDRRFPHIRLRPAPTSVIPPVKGDG